MQGREVRWHDHGAKRRSEDARPFTEGRRKVQPSPIAYADAVTNFARALGAARSGQPEAAKADIAKLAELRDKLREAKDAYWSEIVDIQRQVATAWTLYAEGKYDETLAAMSAASDREDKTEKHPVTPGPLAPARELYGTMLLDRGMAKEALAAFEATLKKEPNRLGATLGAGAAAERSGDSAKAREHYAAAVALKTRRIGLLTRKTDASVATQIDAFRQGLGDLGWVEGKSIIIEHRDAEGEFDRLRVLAAELVGLHMDVIVTVDTPPTKAAQQATKAIPIVIAVPADPVGAGLVSSRSGYSSRNIRHEQPTLAIYGYGPNLGPCSHFNAQIAAPLRFIQKNGQVIQKILKGIVV